MSGQGEHQSAAFPPPTGSPVQPESTDNAAMHRREEYWRRGSTFNKAPIPPGDLRKRERKRRLKKARGAGGVARFFTRQVLWCVLLALVLVVVDVLLYMVFAMQEMDRNYLYGTPATVTRTTSEQLSEQDGTYALGDEAAGGLDSQGAWAQLIAPDGTVLWSRNVPESDVQPASVTATPGDADWGTIPNRYTTNQIALIAHYRGLNGYPTFLWDRPDGILLVGFPADTYETMVITWPAQTWDAIPGYIMGIIGLDLLILFVTYLISRRRTMRAVEPINTALGNLSQGKPTQIKLKGDLQPIADQINETSDVLEHKDQAREQWIRGVSHDIRTPLSMIIGKADALSQSPNAPEEVQAQARAIRTQGVKIKDLIADLNAASQLSFSAEPLNLERIHLPKLLRGCAATYLNSGFDESHQLEFDLADGCADAVVLGDERMLVRLVENLLANARLHNPDGCRIELALSAGSAAADTEAAENLAVVQVIDHGVGAAAPAKAALELRLAHARVAPEDAAPDDAGHGLGLVLVDRIARAHNGAFEFADTPGGGFTARVTLPLA